jgi:hypothetical protein
MACPSFEHRLVIYLSKVVMDVIQIMSNDPLLINHLMLLDNVITVTQLMLSLIINIYATSIIALKTWCVCVHGIFGKRFVD